MTTPVWGPEQPAVQIVVPRFQTWDELLSNTVDPDVLHALQGLDADKTQKLLTELQEAMRGTNIYQLGTLRAEAAELAPILSKYQQTAAYGEWLQSRLDYLDAAQQMEQEMKAAAKPGFAVATEPSLKTQRHVWAEQLARRPWPRAAQDYVPHLKEVFIAERVPPELVWVAEVESSFNPGARSPAGAAGMFQLMPETAREEELSLWPRDERFQPEKSARAAAKYLRSLHEHYGNWDLALAAYNAGEGRVDKLLKQRNAHSFDAIARRLPAETQMYVLKVEATLLKREGRYLSDLRTPKA
jgi:membrane-bound lytic murein transglycosylase D